MNHPFDQTGGGRASTAPRPTALVFQTHIFDRGVARLSGTLQRQCPPSSERFEIKLAFRDLRVRQGARRRELLAWLRRAAKPARG